MKVALILRVTGTCSFGGRIDSDFIMIKDLDKSIIRKAIEEDTVVFNQKNISARVTAYNFENGYDCSQENRLFSVDLFEISEDFITELSYDMFKSKDVIEEMLMNIEARTAFEDKATIAIMKMSVTNKCKEIKRLTSKVYELEAENESLKLRGAKAKKRNK